MGKGKGKGKVKGKKQAKISIEDLFPTVGVSRDPITFGPYEQSFTDFITRREVNNNMNIHKLASVGSLLAFAAAALGHAVFGYSGLELVAGGLFLHAGADLIEDVLS